MGGGLDVGRYCVSVTDGNTVVGKYACSSISYLALQPKFTSSGFGVFWTGRSGQEMAREGGNSHSKRELRISVGELRGRRSINIISCQPCGHLLVVITTNEHFHQDHHQQQIRKTKLVNIGF